MQIYALHGFLGHPSDWSNLDIPVIPVDIHTICPPESNLWEWAKHFNDSILIGNRPRILMGYSLGGRLACHAILQNPKLWTGAIIISAHLGLKSQKDKSQRIQHDESWIKRFEGEPWDSVMSAWNSQEVFRRSQYSFERKEQEITRSQITHALRFWSLGNQDDLTSSIAEADLPILWVAGKNDLAYASSADSLSLSHPKSQIWLAPDAGHRVPWECPELFQGQLRQFIERILYDENGRIMESHQTV